MASPAVLVVAVVFATSVLVSAQDRMGNLQKDLDSLSASLEKVQMFCFVLPPTSFYHLSSEMESCHTCVMLPPRRRCHGGPFNTCDRREGTVVTCPRTSQSSTLVRQIVTVRHLDKRARQAASRNALKEQSLSLPCTARFFQIISRRPCLSRQTALKALPSEYTFPALYPRIIYMLCCLSVLLSCTVPALPTW